MVLNFWRWVIWRHLIWKDAFILFLINWLLNVIMLIYDLDSLLLGRLKKHWMIYTKTEWIVGFCLTLFITLLLDSFHDYFQDWFNLVELLFILLTNDLFFVLILFTPICELVDFLSLHFESVFVLFNLLIQFKLIDLVFEFLSFSLLILLFTCILEFLYLIVYLDLQVLFVILKC